MVINYFTNIHFFYKNNKNSFSTPKNLLLYRKKSEFSQNVTTSPPPFTNSA